jgi:hypothetical protein
VTRELWRRREAVDLRPRRRSCTDAVGGGRRACKVGKLAAGRVGTRERKVEQFQSNWSVVRRADVQLRPWPTHPLPPPSRECQCAPPWPTWSIIRNRALTLRTALAHHNAHTPLRHVMISLVCFAYCVYYCASSILSMVLAWWQGGALLVLLAGGALAGVPATEHHFQVESSSDGGTDIVVAPTTNVDELKVSTAQPHCAFASACACVCMECIENASGTATAPPCTTTAHLVCWRTQHSLSHTSLRPPHHYMHLVHSPLIVRSHSHPHSHPPVVHTEMRCSVHCTGFTALHSHPHITPPTPHPLKLTHTHPPTPPLPSIRCTFHMRLCVEFELSNFEHC